MNDDFEFYRQLAQRMLAARGGAAATPGSVPQVGGFANEPGDWRDWRRRLAGGTPIEAKQSSGDKYSSLTSDPFAMGTGPGAMFGG